MGGDRWFEVPLYDQSSGGSLNFLKSFKSMAINSGRLLVLKQVDRCRPGTMTIKSGLANVVTLFSPINVRVHGGPPLLAVLMVF